MAYSVLNVVNLISPYLITRRSMIIAGESYNSPQYIDSLIVFRFYILFSSIDLYIV